MKRLTFCLMLLSVSLMMAQAAPATPPTLPILGNLHFDWPITNAAITSDFGYRSDVKLGTDRGGADASLHFGIDLIPTNVTNYQARHTQILAAEAGEVYIVYPPPGTPIPGSRKTFPGHVSFGGCVMIRHVIGTYQGKTLYAYTLYGHMKEVWVSEHDRRGNPTKITKGQPIGLMGSTGQSTGPHLHFEILFDPMDFLLISAEMEKASQDALADQLARERLAWLKRKY